MSEVIIGLAVPIGFFVYMYIGWSIAMILIRRCSYDTEPLAIVAGVLWPVGVPVWLGAVAARRAMTAFLRSP